MATTKEKSELVPVIIPKMHVDSIVDLPDEYVWKITEVSRKLIHAFSEV